MAWDPEQYRRFEVERNRPVFDLIHALGDCHPHHVIDAGCGPGNSTEALVHRFPNARVLAFDSDPHMVETARKRLPDIPVEQQDIRGWTPDHPVDLFFSNAVFQWLPDHLPILAALARRLNPDGAIAIQMPDNLEEPTHRLMETVAGKPPWVDILAGDLPRRTPLPGPDAYVDALLAEGLDVTIWRTTYFHRLPETAAIVDFVSGAGLRPWLDQIAAKGGQDAALAYRAAYTQAIAGAYPPLADGTVLMAMPRLFVIARKRR